jgi:hypothetical protein
MASSFSALALAGHEAVALCGLRAAVLSGPGPADEDGCRS